jgi:hypothetical protein
MAADEQALFRIVRPMNPHKSRLAAAVLSYVSGTAPWD